MQEKSNIVTVPVVIPTKPLTPAERQFHKDNRTLGKGLAIILAMLRRR